MFKLSQRSLRNLEGVHPSLVKCVKRAIELSEQDFTVVEGLRSIEQQRINVAKGVSQTMKSRHLKQSDGYGHAVDIYPYYDGSVQCEAPMDKFKLIKKAMFEAADELGITLTWGGSWKTLVDEPHYQLEC